MILTKVALCVQGSKDSLEAQAAPFYLDMKSGSFCVIVPVFDHWTNTQNFDLRGPAATIQHSPDKLSITFPDNPTRSSFAAWLQQTNEAARRGYSTMWP